VACRGLHLAQIPVRAYGAKYRVESQEIGEVITATLGQCMCRGDWRSAGPLYGRTHWRGGSVGICDPHDIVVPTGMTWTSCIIVHRPAQWYSVNKAVWRRSCAVGESLYRSRTVSLRFGHIGGRPRRRLFQRSSFVVFGNRKELASAGAGRSSLSR
jgi:hypothetical protein